jgi:hypothetical protein
LREAELPVGAPLNCVRGITLPPSDTENSLKGPHGGRNVHPPADVPVST